MTLIQLECFLRTAESLSFTKAAEKLFVSRQVVSAHVKALEEELGFSLFARGSRSIALTESGNILFSQLDMMENQFHDAVKEAAAHHSGEEISIGVCEMSDDWDNLLYLFTEKHPNCRLNVDVLSLRALEEGLLGKRFDIVISLYDDLPGAAAAPGYFMQRLRPLQLTIAVSKKHPLACRDRLDLIDLHGEPLLAVSREYSGRSIPNILGHLNHVGAHPKEIKEYPNYKSLELALGNGQGVCVAFDIFLANRGDRLKIYPINHLDRLAMVQLAIAYRRDGSPLLMELAAFLSNSKL